MDSRIIRRDAEIQNFLEEKVSQGGIAAEVASEALSSEQPAEYLTDLLSHGCVSGMVGSLIYYHDTHAFFDKHYDEIEDLRQEFEDSTGHELTIV